MGGRTLGQTVESARTGGSGTPQSAAKVFVHTLGRAECFVGDFALNVFGIVSCSHCNTVVPSAVAVSTRAQLRIRAKVSASRPSLEPNRGTTKRPFNEDLRTDRAYDSLSAVETACQKALIHAMFCPRWRNSVRKSSHTQKSRLVRPIPLSSLFPEPSVPRSETAHPPPPFLFANRAPGACPA